jgi:hypothetical protein
MAEIWGFMTNVERVRGIEPPYSAWEAAALPLSYTRATFGILSCQIGFCQCPKS